MAARQDQGLHIALSIFIFLFVGTFVLWYLYFKSASELQQQLTSTQSQLSDAQTQARTFGDDNAAYLKMMGFDEVETRANVDKAFEEDMKQFGGAYDESRRFYRDVLEYTATEKADIAKREATAKNDIKILNERLLAVEAQKETQVKTFEAQMNKAEDDLSKEQASFKTDRGDLEAKQKELQANLQAQRDTLQAQISALQAQAKELESKLTKSELARDNLLEERTLSSESFEVADGRISWVNQNGTVWINLGDADALRRQITFSVFDTDQRDAANAQKKGSIEVTRVLGEHLAEARVTEDDARNPILTGDQIYSQVWERGKRLHFALTGVVDFDGDGVTDMQQARDLIEMNGGVVDAYLDEEGKVVGNMSVVTRYLVLGDFPEEVRQMALRDGWKKMNEEATSYGIEVITLNEFLNQMGYRPEDRSVELSRGSSSEELPAEATDEGGPSGFRPRNPGDSARPKSLQLNF